MKCEYENAVYKIIELGDIIKGFKPVKPLWKNGVLDKRVKSRLNTIYKILDNQ